MGVEIQVDGETVNTIERDGVRSVTLRTDRGELTTVPLGPDNFVLNLQFEYAVEANAPRLDEVEETVNRAQGLNRAKAVANAAIEVEQDAVVAPTTEDDNVRDRDGVGDSNPVTPTDNPPAKDDGEKKDGPDLFGKKDEDKS